MKINQVEELTGIPKKTIRFYEDRQLIDPPRNPANGYREYSLKDVEDLKKIKLLRKLDIPIDSIRQMAEGTKSLEDCLIKRTHELKKEQEAASKMQLVCQEMLDQGVRVETVDTSFFLDKIDKLEKGGIHFMNVEQKDKQPSLFVPIIITVITVLLMAGFATLFFYLNQLEPAPAGVLVYVGIVLLLVSVGVIIACIQRIKEIKGGELNEARHY